MNLVIYFSIAFVISFLGSLPIGLITLTIVQKTMQNGKQSGILISLGATIMEFVYTLIALISLDTFTQNAHIGNAIKMIAMVIFFGMGIHLLLKTSAPKLKAAPAYDYFDFFRGVVIGAMNLLIIPFWIFIGIWLKTQNILFEENTSIIIFSIGAALGALLAFLVYVLASQYILSKITAINRYTNKAVGILFLGLGIFQLIQLI